MEEFKIGDTISKTTGYNFEDEVRAVFTNRAGQTRVVCELISADGNGDGMLHIFNPNQLRKVLK